MSRFTIFIALLLALTAIAEASIYRTTIITYDDEDANKGKDPMDKCRREIQKRPLTACTDYVLQPVGVLMMTTEASIENGNVPEQCCQQLKKVKEECWCPAIRDMVVSMVGGPYGGVALKDEQVQKALRIPSQCGMTPQKCSM
ncbi:hypothetical protein GIB67_022424 [Kingdonia uniflora]|uniref:Bifunctional inhibitor/plant lipid transfer protein/seed storage helical domain-containing protein n=1 Tax=Kingdonia uniflora TaxID=39325 RepID=A0A7J7MU33_9MAGN|nr:hypothetical protein GIB67_022424 [Kingdonia uniflora]